MDRRTWLITAAAGVWLVGCSSEDTGAASKAGSTPESAPVGQSTPTAARTVPARAATPPLVLPEGTRVPVRTTTILSTKTAVAGQQVPATLAEAISAGGRVAAERGADAVLRIVESDDGGRVKGVAHLSLRLVQVKLANGRMADVESNVISRSAPASKKSDATKIAIASGVGAAIGAIAGGGRGAAIGAASGGAAGTGVVLATHGKPAEIASESLLSFTLRNELSVQK